MYNVKAVMKMIIDIVRLKNNIIDYIEVDEEYTFSEELIKETNMISLSDVHIYGEIYKSNDDYELDLNMDGVMTLPCSMSLEPVEHKFNIKINENYFESLEEIQKNAKKSNNTIDILPILWENILVEIPIRIISPDSEIVTSGDGWKLVTEEETKINPALKELEKLKDILE